MTVRVFLLILCGSAFLTLSVPLSAQNSGKVASPLKNCKVTKDEAEVYTYFLTRESASNGLTVLVTNTDARNYHVDSLNLQLAAQGHGIPPELRADFTNKNEISCVIEPLSGIPNIRFISNSERVAIFAAGWNEFHKSYGKDSVVVTVSRVGFSPDKTLALLHVIEGISHNGAAGELYFLERKNGKWEIRFHLQTVAV